MKPNKATSRTLEILAMMMIGDGVLAAVKPRSHVSLWRGRARGSWWNRMLTYFAEHRSGTRAIGVVELAMGVALAQWQWRSQRV